MNLSAQNEADTSVVKNEGPVAMTVEQFREKTCVPNKLVLVNFKADWCVVCKRQKPIIDQIRVEQQKIVDVLEIDMEDNPLIAAYFEVDGLPINFLFRDGVVIWDHMGFVTKNEIMDVIRVYKNGNK